MAFKFDFAKIPKEEYPKIQELVGNVDVKGLWANYVLKYSLIEAADQCCMFVEIINHFKYHLDESRN